MITAERLRAILHYEPLTGEFTWKVDIRCGEYRSRLVAEKGKRAGCLCYRTKYRLLRIDKKLYREHRLAWLFITGEWPTEDVDHINRIKDDNKWSNLRDVSPMHNAQNVVKPHKDSKSGFLGVSPFGVKWRASLKANGIQYHLGLFNTPELAREAYLGAKKIHCHFAPEEK